MPAFLLLASFLAYGAYIFYLPIHDFYNFFFAERYFVVDSISNGALPYWNPYQ